jgi:hypothetical protein
VNSVPIKYNPTLKTAVPARMIETLMTKHDALRYLRPLRTGPSSDVRDPQFAAMRTSEEILDGIIKIFNTAGYSVHIVDKEAVFACGLVRLVSAGQAIYDLFLRHQMQRKIEKASTLNGHGETEAKEIADQELEKANDQARRATDLVDYQASIILKLETRLQEMADEIDGMKERRPSPKSTPVASVYTADSVPKWSPKMPEPKYEAKVDVKPKRTDYFESRPASEYRTTDYLADIYDECAPPSSVNAAGRLRQSAAADLKRFDGRTRDDFRSRSWLSTVRSAFRRDQLTPGEACLHFPDLLSDHAKNWYRQLPKDIRRSWPSLQEAFEDEYCGSSMAPLQKYYLMSRKSSETPLDYLYRLNVQAIEAGVSYETFKAQAHIKHFIMTCDDANLARHFSLNMPSNVSALRTALQNLQLQESHAKREESKQSKFGRKDGRDAKEGREDRSARSGSRQKPISVHAVRSRSTKHDAGSDEEAWQSGKDVSDDEDADSDEDAESDQGGDTNEAEPKAADEVIAFLAKVFAATQSREGAAKPKHQSGQSPKSVSWQKPVDPCTHCGSHRHRDQDCWRRLTCETCGRNGHPAEHCYQQCRGCGKVHDRGKCHLEEMVTQMKAWFKPTEHAGLLPPTVEKLLN